MVLVIDINDLTQKQRGGRVCVSITSEHLVEDISQENINKKTIKKNKISLSPLSLSTTPHEQNDSKDQWLSQVDLQAPCVLHLSQLRR